MNYLLLTEMVLNLQFICLWLLFSFIKSCV